MPTLDEIKAGGDLILGRSGSYDIAEYGDGQVVGGVSAGNIAAWHGKLTVSSKPLLTIDDVRELYPDIFLPVKKVPLEHKGQVVPGKFAIERADGFVAGIVGAKYQVYEMEQLAIFGEAILDTGEAGIETAVQTRGGSAFFIVFRIPKTIRIGGMEDERLDLFFQISNSLDATSKLRAIATPVRSVCVNSETYAIKTAPRKYELRHTTKLEGRILEARAALDMTFAYTEGIQQLGNQLVGQKMRGSDFSAFLNRLVPLPALPPGEDKSLIRTRRQAVQDAIRDLYEKGENLENIRGTRWAALQAVAEYYDHGTTRRKTATSSAEENRFEALVDPPADALTNRALALLT